MVKELMLFENKVLGFLISIHEDPHYISSPENIILFLFTTTTVLKDSNTLGLLNYSILLCFTPFLCHFCISINIQNFVESNSFT